MADEIPPKETKKAAQPKQPKEEVVIATPPLPAPTPEPVPVSPPARVSLKVEEKPKAEEPKKSDRVTITNKTFQKVIVNLLKKDGKMGMVEIDAKSSVSWPRLGEYGPHVRLLLETGSLTIS